MVLYTKIECLQRTVIDVGRGVDRMNIINVSERHTGIMLFTESLVLMSARGGYTSETKMECGSVKRTLVNRL